MPTDARTRLVAEFSRARPNRIDDRNRIDDGTSTGACMCLAGGSANWEGGMRAPMVIRWPGHIEPGTVRNEIFASLDWLPTFVDIAGGPKATTSKNRSRPARIRGSSRQRAHPTWLARCNRDIRTSGMGTHCRVNTPGRLLASKGPAWRLVTARKEFAMTDATLITRRCIFAAFAGAAATMIPATVAHSQHPDAKLLRLATP